MVGGGPKGSKEKLGTQRLEGLWKMEESITEVTLKRQPKLFQYVCRMIYTRIQENIREWELEGT